MATDLFDRGVRKMAEGKCDQTPIADEVACEDARDALARAFALYPEGLGALRNLANVERGLGKVASAARHFRELARRAPLDPNPARQLWAKFARKEAEALRSRVPHLELKFSGRVPSDLSVVLDGQPLPSAAWNTRIDLDPGAHEVRAEATGHAPSEVDFTLREGEDKTVAIELRPTGVANAAPTRTDSSAEVPSRAGVGVGPYLTISAGAAVTASGLGVGYGALRKKKAACGDSKLCEPDGLAAGRRLAHTSTLLTAVGAAALTTGLIWYLVAKRRVRETTTLAAGASAHGASMLVTGSF